VKNSAADAKAKAAEGNPTHSATTGELDIYKSNCMLLKQVVGAVLPEPSPATFNGIPCEEYPHVVLSPSFACTLTGREGEGLDGAVGDSVCCQSTALECHRACW
jgi:UDP-sugar pyrophosphorylase